VTSPILTALAAAVLHVPAAPERALQVGCGKGDGVLFLAREYPAARVRGVDPSAAAIRAAVGRVGLDPEGRVAFKQGGGRSLPYPDAFFDLVAQAGGRLRPAALARTLRGGGHLVLVGEWRLLDWRLGKQGFVAGRHGEAGGERFHVYRLDTGDPGSQ
jgi:protein-L-isoaspartate O-methyltransferase